VPKGNVNPPRSDADVVAYNAVAKKVMEENGIDILDLYSLALPRLGQIQRAINVHFTDEGSAELAKHVVDFWRLVSARPSR
jgi:acyl-CoA thioesterase-1